MKLFPLTLICCALAACSVQPTPNSANTGTTSSAQKHASKNAATPQSQAEELYNLGMNYAKLAEENKSPATEALALSYFENSLKLAPNNIATLKAAYGLRYRQTLRQGSESFEPTQTLFKNLDSDTKKYFNPPSLALYIHDYLAQAENKDYPQLQALLLNAKSEQPENDTIYIQLANIYRQQGYYPLALATLKEAKEDVDPTSKFYQAMAETYEERAQAEGCSYERTAYLQDAQDNYKQAIPLDPKKPELHYALSKLFSDQNLNHLALHEAQVLLELENNNENLAFLAQSYALLGEHQKALALLDQARMKGLTDKTNASHSVYMYSGEWKKAAQAFADYSKTKSKFSIYDAITADIISEQTGQNLSPLLGPNKLLVYSDWDAAIYSFWNNKLSQQELSKLASNRCEKTELYFYSGYRNLIKGNATQAKRELTAALQQNAYGFIEHPLARYFLSSLNQKSL